MNTRISPIVAGLVAIGVVMAGPGTSASEQEVTLRYRWTKGENLRYRQTQQSTATISGMPGGMGEMVVNTTISQAFKVAAESVAPDGVATLRFTYDAVQMEMTSPMGGLSYDSGAPDKASDPTGGMAKDVFARLLGESFTLVMTPRGEVQKIDGMGRIVEKAFGALPQDPAVAGMLNGLKAAFSDESLKSSFAQGFSQFPERSVKPGDTWNTDFTSQNPMMGAVTTSIVTTLKAVEGTGADQVARLATKATMKSDAKSPVTNPMGLAVQMRDGSSEGDVSFTVATGHLQKAVARSTIDMSMSGSAPDGTTINMQTFVKAQMTFELLPQ